ncbi:response regulator [Methylopila sp. M107]|uniref:hybrid sensor histidine kinase/response regulator n=1 Tax=Methylopila sp. M107 TaxID=1101190 RepID=UPI0003716298|nr:response regulator [Methylopila sp. M107]
MSVISPRISGAPESSGQAAGRASSHIGPTELIEALIQQAPVIVWSSGPGGETEFVSERWRAVTGADPLGPWIDFIHPDDIGDLVRLWSESVATGEPYENEHRIRTQDGSWRRFLCRARPLRDGAGAIQRWVGSMTDIEDLARDVDQADAEGAKLARLVEQRTVDLADANKRVASEAEVRRDTDALYAAYIDNTTDGVFMVSVAPGEPILVVTVNRVMEKALGFSRAQMRGREIGELLPAATAEKLIQEIEACAASRDALRYEETFELDGEDRVFEIALAPVPSADGRTVRVVGSARDLTERRNAEQQLRQSQKMEAVGQLTGGVAHDFNNLLQVVKGNLELLVAEIGGAMSPAIERRLRDAMAGADRGAKLTRQLLAFSRRQPLTPKPTDVGALVASMSDLFERTLGETIEIDIARDPGGWTALVDPAQLENAVLNLAINGRDAMPEGGRLTIRVRNLAAAGEDGERIEIAVTDSGSGMSKSVLARVFEPFFSTKPEGRGTGLGLPQVQGFIEQSHGSIEIESAPDQGTTVRLRLPRSAALAAAEADREVGALDAPPGQGERVLLLEDDEAVRRAVTDLVASLGYRVDAVGSTQEAGSLIERGETYDLLLSDVVMPGSPTPPDFARLARTLQPRLKVLFMSGYAENVIVHQGRVDADVHLIQKPYRKDQLARELRRLLDDGGRADAAASLKPLKILLVEDDLLIAMSIADLLVSFGHTVLEARTGAKARAIVERPEPFDLLLTDLGLPDADGEELAEWCRRQRPGLPIVFATGRDDFVPPLSLAQGGRVAVVTKPFDSETLRQALAESAAGLIART